MKSTQTFSTVFSAILLASAASFSVASHAEEKPATTLTAVADAEMTDGEIRKVNKDTQKLTIRHGEIKNLGMPGMTMLFQVKDPAMLEAVKSGDKVKFVVEKAGGAMVVTKLEMVK